MGILLDAKLLPLYRGLAVRAHAPVARSERFAPLSLTAAFVGDRCRLQVLALRFAQGQDDRPVKLTCLGGEVFPSQRCLFAVESAESGEV
ncbi:MAG: hypothetical protein WCB58_10910 [Acidobacteriaceae bacterium]